jgi:copper(I)-binding protein
MRSTSLAAVVTAAAVFGILSAGCSSTSQPGTPAPAITGSPAAALSIRDPWVKAADNGMSTAFGTLVNTTGKDITVTAATSTGR